MSLNISGIILIKLIPYPDSKDQLLWYYRPTYILAHLRFNQEFKRDFNEALWDHQWKPLQAPNTLLINRQQDII